MTGHSKHTVIKYINSLDSSDQPHVTAGRGRKRKLGEVQVGQLYQLAKIHDRLGSRRLTPLVNKRLRVNISDRSIRRYLRDMQYQWKKPKKKWVLTEGAKKIRVQWAKQRKRKDELGQMGI
jgi:transposase